jgi:hypothetical protein
MTPNTVVGSATVVKSVVVVQRQLVLVMVGK